MAQLTFYPSASDSGWTNSQDAYSDNTVYATAAPGKNILVNVIYSGFDFSSIPAGATINSVSISGEYYDSVNTSIGTFYMQCFDGTTAMGTEYSDTTEPTSPTVRTHTNNGTWTTTTLANFNIRVGARRGNSNTAFTCYLDYVSVTIDYTAATTIVGTAVSGVTAPATGGTPVSTVTETTEWTGTVSWSPTDNPFLASTVYTATITLTAKAGYTLTGVTANQFTVSGSTTCTNSADSGVITAEFPATAATTIVGTVVSGVTVPVATRVPVTAVTETTEWTGTVSWSPNDSTFVEDTVYTATITLTAKTGYTLTGVSADQFTVAGSTSDTNSANSGVITAVFPAAQVSTSPEITSITTGVQITANLQSSTIIVPAGTQSGDLMILMYAKDGLGTTNTPDGWTVLGAYSTAESNFSIFYKQLTGALSDFSVTHTDYEKTSWILLQIPNGDVPQISTEATGVSLVPDSISLTHSFEAGTEVLWLSCWGSDYNRYLWPLDTWPANLPLYRTQNRPTDTSASTSCFAGALNTSASFDPDAWSISGADDWVAYTIAIALIVSATPTINITTTTRTKVSDETGLTTSSVTFQCTMAATQWEARATIDSQTPGPGVGLLVGSGSSINADTDVNFDVTYDELTSGDRVYRVDVYCYVGGVWY